MEFKSNRTKFTSTSRRRNRRRRDDNFITSNAQRPLVAAGIDAKMTRDLVERIPIFPVSKRVTAQRYYSYGHELTSTAGAVSTAIIFSANGIYDPDITGTGHQPMGFDQMMLFYEQACVMRSRIRASFVAENSTVGALRCCIMVSPDTTTLANPQTIIENGQVVTELLAANYSGGRSNVNLALELDIAKYFGRSGGDIVNDSDLQTNAAANPVEQVYFFVLCWNATNSSSLTAGVDVMLEYDVVYNEPRKLAVS
jgi:hypothetical protein